MHVALSSPPPQDGFAVANFLPSSPMDEVAVAT